MAKMDILSKEMIKPSSSTPNHLRSFKLSFLDQIAPAYYIPLIFFYKADQLRTYEGRDRLYQLLKQSLSNVLTQFYPLAGSLSGDNRTVDCNDAGVLYIEAQVHTDLLHVLHTPNVEELRQYCPPDPPNSADNGTGSVEANTSLLAVQVNVFKCGGAAIGVKISHLISDGMSLMTFMRAWAASCRGKVDVPLPYFGLEGLFPPKDLASIGPTPSTLFIPIEKLATERVVFDKETLMRLKHLAASSPGSKVKDPTRLESVLALLWMHFIRAFKSKKISTSDDPEQMFVASLAVNVRGRMDPILPGRSFGNLWRHTIAMPSAEGGTGYSNLVNELRNAIQTIDSDYVRNIQVGDGYLRILKEISDLICNPAVGYCRFTSLCNFPAYEVDFGWGKPTWVCPTTIPMKNFVMLMDSNCEGIEAWVNTLEEDDMPAIQMDQMLMSLST